MKNFEKNKKNIPGNHQFYHLLWHHNQLHLMCWKLPTTSYKNMVKQRIEWKHKWLLVSACLGIVKLTEQDLVVFGD